MSDSRIDEHHNILNVANDETENEQGLGELYLNQEEWAKIQPNHARLLDQLYKTHRLQNLWLLDLFSLMKIAVRLSVIFCITCIYAQYYAKCFIDSNYENTLKKANFLSNFTHTLETTNETIRLRLPFCSCMYMDGFYLRNHTTWGDIYFRMCFFYFSFETILFMLTIPHIINTYSTQWIKIAGQKAFSKWSSRILSTIFLMLVSCLLLFTIMGAYSVIMAYVYELLATFTNPVHSLSMTKPLLNIHSSMQSNSVSIQLLLFLTLYLLINILKRYYLFGVMLINYSWSIKSFLKVAFSLNLLSKILPKINSLNYSNLPVHVFNCSAALSSTNLTINQRICSDTPQEMKVQHLSDGIKTTFNVELSHYIYDNSQFNKFFPLFLCAFLILYFAFIVICCGLEACDLYKFDLDLARLEQHYLCYSEFKYWASILHVNINVDYTPLLFIQRDVQANREGNCLREVKSRLCNCCCMPIYLICKRKFRRNDVDKFLEHVKIKWQTIDTEGRLTAS